MSKVHERDTIVFNDVANTTIATELESRLRELERNIAVAHQFIKMADECYSQVRHEWELLQQDTPSRRHATAVTSQATDLEEHEVRVEHDTLSRGTKSRSSKQKTGRAPTAPTNLPGHSGATKVQVSTPTETPPTSGSDTETSKKAFRSPRPKGKQRTQNSKE